MDDMNEPKRRYFSGDTLQQALVQAANYFNLTPEEIAYKSLEKKHGFLKTRRKVVIEVNPDNPRREAPVPVPPAARTTPPPPPSELLSREPRPAPPVASPAPPTPPASLSPPEPEGRRERQPREDGGRPRRSRERDQRGRDGGDRGPRPDRPVGVFVPEPRPTREARPSGAPGPGMAEEGLVTLPERPRGVSERFPLATGPVAEAAAKAADLLIRVSGLALQPTVFQGDERLEVDLSGEDVDWCFADDGEFVMAVEHLLPRMIRSLSGEAMAVRVDCENFHEIREERLRSLAQRVADEVRRKGRPRVLEPMNPADRRIIHVTLADDPGVVTESEGDGYFKRIMVRPV
jgi:spoIIIJ-associated protein